MVYNKDCFVFDVLLILGQFFSYQEKYRRTIKIIDTLCKVHE